MNSIRGGVLLLAAVLAGTAGLGAGEPEKNSEDYALLAGSVFGEEGLSLAGLRVAVKRKDEQKPRWRAETDRRGEFAVRLPTDAETYEVTTESKEYENQTKTVGVRGGEKERVDVFFRLAKKDKGEER